MRFPSLCSARHQDWFLEPQGSTLDTEDPWIPEWASQYSGGSGGTGLGQDAGEASRAILSTACMLTLLTRRMPGPCHRPPLLLTTDKAASAGPVQAPAVVVSGAKG